MAVAVAFLKLITCFSGLTLAELTSVKDFIFERGVGEREVILFEGEPAKAVYFVVSGVVKVFKTSADGKEQILYLVRPGESFNEVPIFGGAPNLASAEAMGPVLLLAP